jgi:hypothetical protein
MNTRRRELLTRLPAWSLWIALIAAAIAASLQKIRSFDYWWHLRTGQLIRETGAVPTVDPYTFSAEGARWIDIHWLFQLALRGVYGLGGHEAVVFAKLGLVLVLIGLLARIGHRRGREFVTVLGLALMLVAGSDRLMPRPEMLSFVLLAAVLMILHRFERTRDAWIYAVIPIQLLWVNVHGLFALGISLCCIHLVAETAVPLLRRSDIDWLRVRRLATVTILAGLTSLLNPNTLDAAIYPFQQLLMIGTASQRVMSPQTQELIPLATYWQGMTPLAQAVLLALALFSLTAMLANRQRLRASDLISWLAFLGLAFAAQRNTTLFAIVSTPIAVKNWNEYLDRQPGRERLHSVAVCALALVLIGVAVDFARGRFYSRLGFLREPGVGVMEVIHPVRAANWIAEVRPAGPIFHSMIDGGYLTWRLYPDYKILGDGRLEVFGLEKKLVLTDITPKQIDILDAKYRFGTALLNFGYIDYRRILRHLYENPAWRLSFVDDSAAVFIRTHGDPGDGGLDVDDPLLLPTLDHEHGISDAYRRRARMRFFRALGRGERAKEIARELARRYPEFAN